MKNFKQAQRHAGRAERERWPSGSQRRPGQTARMEVLQRLRHLMGNSQPSVWNLVGG